MKMDDLCLTNVCGLAYRATTRIFQRLTDRPNSVLSVFLKPYGDFVYPLALVAMMFSAMKSNFKVFSNSGVQISKKDELSIRK